MFVPNEILCNILEHLDSVYDVLKLSSVNSQWAACCEDRHVLSKLTCYVDSDMIVSKNGSRGMPLTRLHCIDALTNVEIRDSSLIPLIDSCMKIQKLVCNGGINSSDLAILISRQPQLSHLTLKAIAKFDPKIIINPSKLQVLDLGLAQCSWNSLTKVVQQAPKLKTLARRGSSIPEYSKSDDILSMLEMFSQRCKNGPVTLDFSNTPGLTSRHLLYAATSLRKAGVVRRDSGVYMEESNTPSMTLIVNDCDVLTQQDIDMASKLSCGGLQIIGNPRLRDESPEAVRDYIRYLCGV